MHTVTVTIYVVITSHVEEPSPGKGLVTLDYVTTDRNQANSIAAQNPHSQVISHKVGIDSDFAGFEIETR